MKTAIQSILLAIAITLGIGLMMRFVGIHDSFFYHPNDRVYQEPGGA